MKLTKTNLKQIIKEEISEILKEFASAAGGRTSAGLEMPLKGILSKQAEKDWEESPSIMNDKTKKCESKGQCYDAETAKCVSCGTVKEEAEMQADPHSKALWHVGEAIQILSVVPDTLALLDQLADVAMALRNLERSV